ncbi:MAG: hypothetical protein L6R40_000413 [Gallowayella cf. fulva]|nr:MAG: hypothetical protein L6R40_000413 [Xanthomendoza cf. fulva]
MFDSHRGEVAKSKQQDAHEHQKVKKRKREAQEEIESPLAPKKRKSKSQVRHRESQNNPSEPSAPQPGSPFYLQTASLYLSLPPIAQTHPLQGLCAEHLSPLILTYYPPLLGVILSFHNARLSTDVSQDTNGGKDPVLAQAIDEYAALHVWVTADFLIFRPRRGNTIEGWVNLQNEGNIGLVCWNFFNATIEKKRLPGEWKWIPGGLEVGGPKKRKKKLKGSERVDVVDIDQEEVGAQVNGIDDIEGHFEDGDGRRIGGFISFTVKDVESSRSSGGDNGFLSIEGTFREETEERSMRESESKQEIARGKKQQRKEHDGVYAMAGAIVVDEDEDSAAEIPKKLRRRSAH